MWWVQIRTGTTTGEYLWYPSGIVYRQWGVDTHLKGVSDCVVHPRLWLWEDTFSLVNNIAGQMNRYIDPIFVWVRSPKWVSGDVIRWPLDVMSGESIGTTDRQTYPLILWLGRTWWPTPVRSVLFLHWMDVMSCHVMSFNYSTVQVEDWFDSHIPFTTGMLALNSFGRPNHYHHHHYRRKVRWQEEGDNCEGSGIIPHCHCHRWNFPLPCTTMGDAASEWDHRQFSTKKARQRE